MTALPNPASTRAAFRTRAEAEAARIMPGVTRATIRGMLAMTGET